MRIGAMRHRVALQRPSDELDSAGQPVEWLPVDTVWGSVEPLRGREFWAAQQAHAELTVRVRIRYRSDVKAAWRVLAQDQTLELVAPPVDPDLRHRELELLCREVTP